MYTLCVDLRNKLREIRLLADINQTQLARLCCVSRQTIHAIETAKYTPSVELALKLSRELDINVEEIFSLKEQDEI